MRHPLRGCIEAGSAAADRRAAETAGTHPPGVTVLDVIYLALTVALFALVGLIAKGAEKL